MTDADAFGSQLNCKRPKIMRVFMFSLGLINRCTTPRQGVNMHYSDNYKETWCLHTVTDTTYAPHAHYVDSDEGMDVTG